MHWIVKFAWCLETSETNYLYRNKIMIFGGNDVEASTLVVKTNTKRSYENNFKDGILKQSLTGITIKKWHFIFQ
ncbi:Phosphomannomutase [Dirofilaria immitis]